MLFAVMSQRRHQVVDKWRAHSALAAVAACCGLRWYDPPQQPQLHIVVKAYILKYADSIHPQLLTLCHPSADCPLPQVRMTAALTCAIPSAPLLKRSIMCWAIAVVILGIWRKQALAVQTESFTLWNVLCASPIPAARSAIGATIQPDVAAAFRAVICTTQVCHAL